MVSSRAAPAGTFTLSVSALPAHALLALSQWAPRSGRSPQYFEFEHSLHQWCMARGISYAALPLSAPVHENMFDVATRKDAKEQGERDARFRVAYAEWQHYNTALYWALVSAFKLEGPWQEADARTVEGFLGDLAADGNAFLLWGRSFASLADKESQSKLRSNVAAMRLAVGSSQVALHKHCELLRQQWELLLNTQHDDVLDYWDTLLVSLPTRPEGSMLVTVRTWLVGRVEELRNNSSTSFAVV